MNKLLKVTLEYDDHISTIEDKEAQKWDQHCQTVSMLAKIHGANVFDDDPIKWETIKKWQN